MLPSCMLSIPETLKAARGLTRSLWRLYVMQVNLHLNACGRYLTVNVSNLTPNQSFLTEEATFFCVFISYFFRCVSPCGRELKSFGVCSGVFAFPPVFWLMSVGRCGGLGLK